MEDKHFIWTTTELLGNQVPNKKNKVNYDLKDDKNKSSEVGRVVFIPKDLK